MVVEMRQELGDVMKAQGLLWLGDLYTAVRVIVIAAILALLGISGWASAEQGKFVSPIEVIVSPEVIVNPIVETVVEQSFPDASICDDDGRCFKLTFEKIE